MSFTTEIKRELVRTVPDGRPCRLALLQAFLKACGGRTEEGFFFVSENESVAAYILGITEELGAPMTLTDAVRDPKHGRDKLTFSKAGEIAAVEEIFSASVGSDGTATAFIKGAFLGGGSCVLPHDENRTGYHLEFVFSTLADAELFMDASERLHLLGGIVERGERYVIYCKSREGIGDFLSVLGANNSLRVLERTAAVRDESNNRNRLENCMAGNVDRSVTASARQIKHLASLADGNFTALPESLRETAEARLNNPTLTYSELAALLGVSKGCLQHRLKKLMSFKGEKP